MPNSSQICKLLFLAKSDTHIDSVSKVCFKLTNELIAFLNATVKYSIVPTVPTFGYINKTTKEWNGLIGDFLNDRADVGATPLFIIAERLPLLEYITNPTAVRGGFIFRAPKLSFINNIYALPFDRMLWICLAVLVFVITILLWGSVMIELKMFKSLQVNVGEGEKVYSIDI